METLTEPAPKRPLIVVDQAVEFPIIVDLNGRDSSSRTTVRITRTFHCGPRSTANQ
ncbi:hypothetical protein [Plantactinospora sp. B24E8]|uniref:hypothetical protein n=1 Tax=Plantactinospora sp. B24E8 TaxID=3153567 RepID=UPI00325E3271